MSAALPRVVAFATMSVDGFVTTPDTPVDDADPDGLLADVDAVVLGRATWDALRTADPWPYEGLRVVVLTSRPAVALHGEVLARGSLRGVLQRLGAEGARTVYVDGGTVIRAALDAGLVHDLDVCIVPVVVGWGTPLFGNGARALELVSLRPEVGGIVHAHYAVGEAIEPDEVEDDEENPVRRDAFEDAVRAGPSHAAQAVIAALWWAATIEWLRARERRQTVALPCEDVVDACFKALTGVHPAAADHVRRLLAAGPIAERMMAWDTRVPAWETAKPFPAPTGDVAAVVRQAVRDGRTPAISSVGWSRRAFTQLDRMGRVLGTADERAKELLVDLAAEAVCDLRPFNRHDSRAHDGATVLIANGAGQPRLWHRFLARILESDARDSFLKLTHGLDGLMPLVVALGGPDAALAVARAALEIEARGR